MPSRTAPTVFGYLRVSSTGQAAGDGFKRQRAAVEAYAKGKKWQVSEWASDTFSGASDFGDRPGLRGLLEAVRRATKPVVVLVEAADRLARDLIQSEVLLNEFRKLGVEVHDSRGNSLTSDEDNPSSRLIRQVLGAVAEFEKSNLVLKLRGARERKKQAGGWANGVRPFGALQGEEETLELIFKLRTARHLGYREIARELNAAGVASRSGRPWSGMAVKKIVDRGRGVAEMAREA